MIVKQEESTPIGDYFHDSGIYSMYNNLVDIVDEFEVDTDDINTYCDGLINALKGLKAQTKKVESAWAKHKAQEELSDRVSIGFE